MWILLTLALAGSDPVPKPKAWAPWVQGGSTEGKSWFRSGPRAFGSLLLPAPRPAEPAATAPAMKCPILVLKADPKLDPRIARPAPPSLDPKFVRPSPCQE